MSSDIFFFFHAEDGIRAYDVTGVQTCALPIYEARAKLIVLAEAEPTKLYPEGDGAFEFERTASRLQEMRSADWLTERG